MMIEARKLINLPIAAQETLSKIGEIRQVLVDPNNGQLVGFIIQEGNILSPKKVLSIMDVLSWDPKGLVIDSEEVLFEPEEIVRLNELMRKRQYLLGMRAKTESNRSLGYVENFLINTDTSLVVKYYLKDMLGKKRIIEAEKVVRIEKAVIFSDNVLDNPPAQYGTQTA